VAIGRDTRKPHRFEYDQANNLTTFRFPDDSATRFTYDDQGRLVAVRDRNGNQTRYGYSEAGQPTAIIDPLGNETRFEYDEWNLPSAILFPNERRHEFEYDLKGFLRQMFEDGREHANFSVDEEGGTVDVEYTDGTEAHFVLSDGRVVEAANETCKVKFEYDDQDRILREETDGQTVTYLRNEVGALTGILTPEGKKLTFERDKEHRVRRIIDWSGGSYEIGYESNGALARIGYPNGSVVEQRSTPIGLPEFLEVTSPRSRGEAITSCRWEYDECDRLKSETKDGKSCEYRYDHEGRLVETMGLGLAGTQFYGLDANGNRLQDEEGDCEFNGLNQLVRRGKQRFQYDGRGHMSAGTCPKGPATYTYNGRDQLIAVATSTGETRYAYDAFGRRIRKESGGSITRYVWAGWQLLSEITTEEERSTRRDFLMFPERPCPLAMRVNGEVYYLHPGRRAEPTCMTDGHGEVVWKAVHDAFGEAHVEIEKVPQPWRLAGQYYDQETGLHYALARYYYPELGRYLTLDPLRVDGGSLNFYTYCDGDPVNRLDPTGGFIFCAIIIGAVIGAAIGAGIEAYRQHKTKGKIDDGWAIAKAALIGGAVGAIGGGVGAAIEAGIGATTVAGLAGAGALSGMGASAVEQCAEAALTGDVPTATDFLTNVVIGGAIGAVTAGIGGLLARRVRQVRFRRMREASRFLKDSKVPRKVRRQVIKAFKSDAKVETLTKDIKVHRYYGGKADPRGRWLTPQTLKNPAKKLALPPGSTAEKVKSWTIPKGTKVLTGRAARNFGQPGGAKQIYVPDPSVLK
jgi:RHS repeat-associated protein